MNANDYVQEFILKRDFKNEIPLLLKNEPFCDEILKLVENKSTYPLSEYASWIWTHIAKNDTKFTQKYYKRFISILFHTSNQSVLRNVVATLVQLEISEYKEGELIDLLFTFLKNKKNKVALHVYSIYLLQKFLKKYPELTLELTLHIDLLLENASPSLVVAARKFKEQMKKGKKRI